MSTYPWTKVKPGATCPKCNEGKWVGVFYKTCTNPKCPWYSTFAHKECGICGQPRHKCSC
jgi:hypothetical protein